ncbi:hypothetical protein B0I37DRAFT_362728 [Chaetomium sp. MPI-CAGE-AT-0009]|nr:hypothetical protein B0I37DRAFT_362728 [Chaetomium sp. MPI-CAGE-AT-0009]
MKVLGVDHGTDPSAELKDATQRQMHMRELVEKGQAKISTPSRVTETVSDVAQFILTVKPIIDAAVRNIPQAALPWAGVCVGLQILLNPAKATRSNFAGILHVVSRMDWYCALSEHLLKEDHMDESLESIPPLLKMRIIDLYKALLLYQMKSVCSYYRLQGLVFLRALASWDEGDGYLNAVHDAEKRLLDNWGQFDKIKAGALRRELIERAKQMEDLLETISRQDIREFIVLQKEMRREDEDIECLRQLFVVDPQDDMEKIEQKKDVLLHEAYKWILDTEAYATFTDWNHDDAAPPPCRLLWVKGHAGTGKTMLLMGIIRHLLSRPAGLAPYVSHFFCQGTEQPLNSAMVTLRSLMWMLLVQQPHLISHLQSKYENGSDIFQGGSAFISLSGVLKSMLKDPDLAPVYFIVDALDECEEGLPDLIQLISDSLAFTNKVKWLVSSRPTVELKTPGTAGALVELDTQKLETPVRAYIDYKLSAFVGQRGYTKQILDGLSVEVPKRAENTFLWVWLFFKELGKTNRRFGKRLLNGKDALPTVKKFPPGLSSLYGRIMDTIAAEAANPQYCRDALAAVVLALRPLTLPELAVLAGLPSDMARTVVESCGSLLTVKDETIYLIHQSAKDYLYENFSSKLEPGGVAQAHANLSRRSIAAMSSILKRNIYNLDFDVRLEAIAPRQPDPLAPIRYSCVLWVDHLLSSDSSMGKGELLGDGIVLQFLKERFLNWLESLALLGEAACAATLMAKLQDFIPKSDKSSGLAGFLTDALPFVQRHMSMLEEVPLQLYATSLVFSPAMSEVKRAQWQERLPSIRSVTGVGDHWYRYQRRLERHSGRVKVVAFSPDGKTLVTASDDPGCAPRLWDVATGMCRQTLDGHNHLVKVVAFSPDGKTLASGSVDRTVRLWDVATGEHQHTLDGHSNGVKVIAFSPDSKLLASTSEDCIVRLWNVAKGTRQHTLSGHSDQVEAVAFSPDSKILASGSDDGTVRLWDVPTGVSQLTLAGHSDEIKAVAFSPDSKMLASGSDDGTIHLWDIPTGVCRQTLEGRSDWVLALAFSPDGKTLASGVFDGTVQLWDLAAGLYRETSRTFSPISELSFSEDNQYLKTNRGLVRLPSTPVSSNNRRLDYALLVSRLGGIRMDGKCVLWLPKEVSTITAALYENTVVLHHLSGRQLFLQFNLGSI